MNAAATNAPEKLEFKTELKQLLDLIIHSLYTKKEIFLRELISNAADAIDKLRFESLKEPELVGGDSDFRIRVIPDEKAGTITVSDNGIGMSREAIVSNLGTIARSGTREFLRDLQSADAKDRPELIGQFGVGFYSSFMVADRVTVLSRAAGPNAEGVRWESDGQGEFSVEPAEKSSRGTDVTLHLREDAKEFLQGWRLREIIKRYSDFISHPIVLVTEEEKDGKTETKEETVNSRQAIWLRPKNEVKEKEYNEFYKQLTRDTENPLKTIHIAAEGTMEFRALLFIPAHRGMDWLAGPERKSGIDLYVRRVLIQHESEELAPPYLRFVKGVVDSADLPLNVSRETLQHNPLLAKIRSNLVNRVLKTLDEMKSSDYDSYLKFYKEFGANLKEGAAQDWSNRDRLADLLLFESTKTKAGEFTSLADYVSRMPADQKEIYFLTGETRSMLENSPYVESFKARGQEVLLLTDPVDEYLTGSLHQYKDKPLRPVDRGETEADKEQAEKNKERQGQFAKLIEALKTRIPEVQDVRLSTRLRESAACLVADEGAMGAHLERLLQRMGRGEEVPASKRILELNPDDPAVQRLRELAEKDPADPRVETYGRLLYDQAVIAEGSRIQDPAAFAKRVNALIAGG
ncbi:MAG TPA: molecular chaperone HtpG [Tepidisphaeraceae bacterium]|nr:molecular chaperone HtpG [Tepidisphaeraceae bacterium]